MKRFLAILLSALMVFSTMSVMATEVENETPEVPVETPDESGLTNVAYGRPVFTSWTSGANEPDRMVDVDPTTGWVSNKFTALGATVIDGSYIWALVDLGTEYTIDEIKITVADNDNYVSRDRQDYSVYVTNTRPETNLPVNCPVDTMGMTEVYTAPSLANTTEGAPAENVIDVAAVEATQGNKYRYVFLQKSNVLDKGNGTGMGHWYWAINDLQVLTSDDVAEDAPRWIEVAKNRPAFAGKTNDGDANAARNAIDGDIGTTFIAADWRAGIKARFVVDLEKEYPIEGVVYTPRYTANELHGFEIYATNDSTFEYMALIHKQPLNAAVDYGHLYYEAPEALNGKKYRYIVVQANDANNNLGISDLKVYTSDITAERPFMANRAYVASINCAVTSDLGEDAARPFKNLTDLESSTACLISSSNESGYIAVDLVKPQTVDYVTYALKGFPDYDYGLEIVAANEADLSDGVVMYSAIDDEGNYFCPTGATGNTKGILLFPATEEMEGKKYRYVGMRYPKNLTTSTQIVRGGANMFEVYTKGSNMSAAMSNAEITKEGYAFTLTIKDLLTINDKLSFIGAVYDTDGTLLEVKTADVKPAKKLNRNTTEVSATIDFADSDYTDSNAIVKLMLWDSISGTAAPVLEEEFENLYEEKVVVYESVTQYATSHKATSNATATTYEIDPENKLVDGDLTTRYGAGPVNAAYYTFVDLGEGGRRVDKVAITVNDNINAERIKGQKYYLANTLPINGADRSEWVFLGERTENNTRMEFILTKEQAGTYRYVVADCTDPAVGDYVNEIEVYKDSSIVEPVVAQNVSRGKSVTASHAGIADYNNSAVVTDGVTYAMNSSKQFIIQERPSAVCIDLDADYAIEKVVVDAVTKDFTKNVEVYISDFPSIGAAIPVGATRILDGSADGWDSSVKTIELDEAIDGRYVIITQTTTASGSFRLSEVSVYGIPTGEASYEVEVEVVESSADVTSYHAQLQIAGWAINYNAATPTNVFTDKNSGTIYGRGNGGDVAWIDLGEAKKIDAVNVQINDQYMAIPSTPMVFYVTNDDPAEGLKANTDADGYLTVPDSWISVNGDGYVWTKSGLNDVTCMLSKGGEYRYVIVTDPKVDYNDPGTDWVGTGLKAYISEITPYAYVEK